MAEPFYGTDLAAVHHESFGAVARAAGSTLLDLLGGRRGAVVDLGSGSGIMAGLLTAHGCDVLGVDRSPAMIAVGEQVAPAARFELGSLWDVDLPACIAVTAIGEALSYAADTDDTDRESSLDSVTRLARRVRRALAPGGVFLFDVATPGRGGASTTREVFHDHDTWSLFFRAEERDGIEVRTMTLFRRSGEVYRRSDETHVVRLFEPDAIRSRIQDAGMAVERLDGYSAGPFGPGVAGFVATRP